jgi:hypothetical protein
MMSIALLIDPITQGSDQDLRTQQQSCDAAMTECVAN